MFHFSKTDNEAEEKLIYAGVTIILIKSEKTTWLYSLSYRGTMNCPVSYWSPGFISYSEHCERCFRKNFKPRSNFLTAL